MPNKSLPLTNNKIETLPENKISVFKKIAKQFGTPLYVYFESNLVDSLKVFQNIKTPYGLLIRYAVKAKPNGAILRLYNPADLQ